MEDKYSEEEILLKIDPSLVLPPKYDPTLSSFESLKRVQEYKARLNEEKYNRILKLFNYWLIKLDNKNIFKKIKHVDKEDKSPLKSLLLFRNISINDIISNPEVNKKVIKKKYMKYSNYFKISIYMKEYDESEEEINWNCLDKENDIETEDILKLFKELLNTIDYKLRYKVYNGVKFYYIAANYF